MRPLRSRERSNRFAPGARQCIGSAQPLEVALGGLGPLAPQGSVNIIEGVPPMPFSHRDIALSRIARRASLLKRERRAACEAGDALRPFRRALIAQTVEDLALLREAYA